MGEPRSVADAGLPGAEVEHLAAVAQQLVVRLSAVMRTARTHDVSNQAFQRQLQEFLAVVQDGLEEEPELALGAIEDQLYVNGVRLRAHPALMSAYHSLIGEFERRSLGGIRFHQGVHAAELERFFQLFMAAEDPALAERLVEAVQEASIEHVAPVPIAWFDADDITRQLDEHGEPSTERGRAKRVFWRAVIGTRKIILRAAQSGRPDLRHAKRLVQPVVDNILRHEYSIVGLTALKDHDEYTYAHCVNVSILSVSMGHVLGFSRQALADLGVAALVHDIGKVSVPGEVLRKPAKLDPDEWKLMKRHPLEGVKMVARLPGLSTLALDSMRTCLEHHMNIDHTGYPDIALEWRQGTLARIVAVADCFDAMTAHRAYHKRPFSSFEALQYFLGPNRVRFDPAVLWALVKTVGLYPAGSVLVTDSGYVVLSLSPNPEDLRRPNCRVLVHPDGTREPEDGEPIWNPMPSHEHVARVLRPEELSIESGRYLAA